MVDDPPPLTYEQTERVLAKLADLQEPVVLVGGQALNFWAGFFADEVAALADAGPYTSKDIDFVGSHRAVKECAARLKGTPVLATIDDANTPNTGLVIFEDEDGYRREIDFLDKVAGVSESETYTKSLVIHILDERGASVATVRVMNPLSCLKSRTHNVAVLPGYSGEHALNQLRAAMLCANAFALDLPDPLEALTYNQEVIALAHGVGLAVYQRHGIDVMDALVERSGIPEQYFAQQLPRARETLAKARLKTAAAAERAAVIAAKTRTSGS